MQTFTHDGVALNYHDTGPKDGRVVMFGNSLGTDLRVWDLLVPLLPEGLRIVRYDKRGHGLSDCPPAPYTIDTLAGDAAALADHLGLKDITLVGLSIGGLIGQWLATNRPDLMQALVLMDTGAKIGTPEMWQDRVAALQAGGIDGMADAVLDRWFAPAFRNDAARLTPWRHMLTRTPLQGYIGCCQAIAGADFTETTKGLRLPVMAMVGADDGATTPDLMQATADLCGAPCHVVDTAGHIPCVEQPQQVAALITQFLKDTANG